MYALVRPWGKMNAVRQLLRKFLLKHMYSTYTVKPCSL